MTRLSVLLEYKSSLQSVLAIPDLSRNTLKELKKLLKEMDMWIQKVVDIDEVELI